MGSEASSPPTSSLTPVNAGDSLATTPSSQEQEKIVAQDYLEVGKRIRDDGRLLAGAAGEAMKAVGALGRAVYGDGALSNKTKELIAYALSVAARCDGCLAYHGARLVQFGATRKEVVEAIGVAVQMGGGPAVIYGGEALRAFDTFASQAAVAAE